MKWKYNFIYADYLWGYLKVGMIIYKKNYIFFGVVVGWVKVI